MIAYGLAMLLSTPTWAHASFGVGFGYEQDAFDPVTTHRGARLDLDLLPAPWWGAELFVAAYPFSQEAPAPTDNDPRDQADLRGRGAFALRLVPVRTRVGKSELDMGAYAGPGIIDLLHAIPPETDQAVGTPEERLMALLGMSAELRGPCMGLRLHLELSHASSSEPRQLDPAYDQDADLWIGASFQRWF